MVRKVKQKLLKLKIKWIEGACRFPCFCCRFKEVCEDEFMREYEAVDIYKIKCNLWTNTYYIYRSRKPVKICKELTKREKRFMEGARQRIDRNMVIYEMHKDK